MARKKHHAASSLPEPGPVARGGRIELGFGFEQYFALAAAGLVGTLPLVASIVPLGMALGAVADRVFGNSLRATSGGSDVLGMVLGVPAAAAFFFGPAIVACRVLRARQPKGASVTWDESGVVEWDGGFRRAIVSWQNIEVSHRVWGEGRLTEEALQLVDSATGACISVWTAPPKGAPFVRRRLVAAKLLPLRSALEARSVPLTHHPDWSRARDPDRAEPLRSRWVGRLGYPAALVAPVLAMPSPVGGVAVAAVGAALLVFRARPVLAELAAIRTRLAAPLSASLSESDAIAARVAVRDKQRAARVEAFVRVGFVVMLISATLVAVFIRPVEGANLASAIQ